MPSCIAGGAGAGHRSRTWPVKLRPCTGCPRARRRVPLADSSTLKFSYVFPHRFPKPPWGEGLLHRVASLSASKPAGGGLDAQAAEATTGGVNAIAEVPDAGAACGATAEGLGAPPVELSHGSRSPAQAAGLASRSALIISSKVSGSVSPLAARSLIVKPSSEDGICFMSNLLTASYLTGRSKSK